MILTSLLVGALVGGAVAGVVIFWDEVKNFVAEQLGKINPYWKDRFLDFSTEVERIGNNIKIKVKNFFRSKRNSVIEQTTTKTLSQDEIGELPEHVRHKLYSKSGMIDITADVKQMLELEH